MSRTTVSIRDDVYERLEADKGSEESWTGYLERLYEDAAENAGHRSERTVNALTEGHIDDIARSTADEVENRMTRR